MKFQTLAVCGVATTALAAAVARDEEPLSIRMADTIMTYGNVHKVRWYTESVFYRGVEYVYNATNIDKYRKYVKDQIDPMILENGSFPNPNAASYEGLDNIRVAETLLFLWDQYGEERYIKAIDRLRNSINQVSRTGEGAFWHMVPAPNQQWLDGLWMVDTFYARYTGLFEPDNTTAWDDIALQYDLMEKHTRDPKTGLLYHGYDQSLKAQWADPVTGASPEFWNRAIGWYFMSLLDVLDYFPEEHPGHARLTKYFTTLAEAIKKTWSTEGGWWLVMGDEHVGRKGNYIESSGTAMFVTGFLKGLRKGILEEKEYQSFTYNAYDAMVDKFVNETDGRIAWEGTVKVGHLNGNATFESYVKEPVVQNWLLGVGPFIYSSVEIETMRG